MGRKHKTSVPKCDEKCFSKHQKRDINIIIDSLLKKCTQMPSAADDWDNYLAIHGHLTRLQEIQNGHGLSLKSREDKFTQFCSWIQENGVSLDNIEITEFPDMGYGLRATKDMKEGELFVSVPRKVMMTTQAAGVSCLSELMKSDRMLQAMPNVCLAIFILCEAHKDDSKWRPYLDVLPVSYSTVLYYTPDELLLLKKSPVFAECLTQCRSIARQYAYFYKLFQNSPAATKVPMKDWFTYNDYRWAVSTVMTRQNPIPTEDGSSVGYGLIPLWDMCNHQPGQVTSVYNTDTQCSEGYCMADLKVQDQIFICYGERSSGEFFLHNGFASPSHQQDYTTIKLGVSKNDSLHSLKAHILSLVGLHSAGSYNVLGWGTELDPDLLAFLRIFVADRECLETLNNDASLRSKLRLQDAQYIFDDDAAKKFLQKRASLLLKAYPENLELEERSSFITKQAHNLLKNEKKVLEYVSNLLQNDNLTP